MNLSEDEKEWLKKVARSSCEKIDTGETYKGIEYMKAECESLAQQLREIA